MKNLPGRLSDPDMNLLTDPRVDPRIAAAVAEAGDIADALGDLKADAPFAECLDYCFKFEQAAALAHPLMEAAMPAFDSIESWEERIAGVDGNAITLYIDRPSPDRTSSASSPQPGILHLHG